jgi:hypothetical protein
MEVNFFDNETNYRYRIRVSKKVVLDSIKKAPEAPQKRSSYGGQLL